MLTSASGISTVFNQVGINLTQLRVAKYNARYLLIEMGPWTKTLSYPPWFSDTRS